MHRSEVRSEVSKIGAAAIGAAALVLVVKACTGCGGTDRKAEFAVDLATCDLAKTCNDYVTCRKDVAAKYGRQFSGTCVAKDGGP